jgi:hypothetical protein
MFLCGYAVWGLGFLVVAVLVSIALGVAVRLLTIKREGDRIPILAAIGVFLTMIFGCGGYWIYCGNDFECDRGFGDYFRIPVQYPYQISAIDSLDQGCLDVWAENNSTIVCGITDYAVKDTVMVGKLGASFGNLVHAEQWFSVNLGTGELVRYSSEQAFLIACRELGFAGVPEPKSIRTHFEEH